VGDLVPNSDTTKLLACAFIGIAIVVSSSANWQIIVEKQVFFKAPQIESRLLYFL
jgi:hypothetical protein